jgi:spore coat-associated protein N
VPVLRRSRQLLLPLATLLAAGSIVIASGADFTSSSASAANTYATGTLTHSNDRDGAVIFSGTGLKPGESVGGTAVIRNDGSLPAGFTLTEFDVASDFVDGSLLHLNVTEDGVEIYDGALGAMPVLDLGEFAPNDERTYLFTATLDSTAGNDEQGRTATVKYGWDAVQTP